ncbi:PcfJ domain-containing protein [Rhizobium sp. CBK13]|uniref:PcfJ domain-containing protein n=1 Tax=Rhizobium sp. CBK13 TaxID=3031399 RepID=UPI0023AF0AAB|nr:PcfJ domain-containing protein [Rhizobium sp. CBK13]MDE8762569.1 PcfJ domain-containing protein [Rhizobium sp. CBK13]
MAKRHKQPEYSAAERALIAELDLGDRTMIPIRSLVDCSLVRLFWEDWRRSDARDPMWIATPGDHDENELHRVDGWPEYGDGTVERKWSRRARLWMSWFSIDAWHVCDWLVNAVSDGEQWLWNLDDAGHPRKLTKCGNLQRLVHEATKGLRQRNAEVARQIVLGPNDERFMHDLGVGHTLVRLCSRAALRKEGTLMHHCIGQGSYDDFLDDPDVVLASVRDPDGDPLATLEVRGGYIRQFRARANAEPSEAVKDLVAGAADTFGWQDWRDRPGYRADNQDYGPEAVVILRDLPPPRRRG